MLLRPPLSLGSSGRDENRLFLAWSRLYDDPVLCRWLRSPNSQSRSWLPVFILEAVCAGGQEADEIVAMNGTGHRDDYTSRLFPLLLVLARRSRQDQRPAPAWSPGN